MKRILFIAVAFGIMSCGPNSSTAPIVVDEIYSPSESELYSSCIDLRGVGQFVIDKTTFKQVLSDKDFRNVATSSSDRRSNLYNGHWGSSFWIGEKRNNMLSKSAYAKSKWMEERAGSKLKQLTFSVVTGFSVGDLKFKTFDMAFLNDTLVAIFFYPNDDIENDVLSHYKEKYGSGRGKLYSFYETKPGPNSVLAISSSLDEERVWENECVALAYEKHEYFFKTPDKEPTANYKHSMMIYSKKRYPVFEQNLLEIAAEYDQNAAASKEQALKSL